MNTLSSGSIYVLLGVGIVILFRSTGVINFAQGAFVVVGAYLFYNLNSRLDVPLFLALAVVVLTMALFGATTYLLVFRRLVGTETFVLVIATLGLGVVIQTAVVLVEGPTIITPPIVLSISSIGVWNGLGISVFQIYAMTSAAVVVILLHVLLRRSQLGSHMRAVADNTLLAGFTRVRVHRMSGLAWAISGICAAVAGVSLSMQTSLDPIGLQAIGLVAFAGVLLGGMDSIAGAVAGGLILALVQQVASTWLGGAWADPVAYMLLMAVLLVRPQGLFGSKSMLRL